MPPATDTPASEPRLSPDRHDVVLALALGALASADHFERAVQASSAATPALEPDDPVVLASLGVIALGRTLRRWLDNADTPLPAAGGAAQPDEGFCSREALR